MTMVRLLVFFSLKVLVLNTNVYLGFAEAPNTPKILFTSVKDRINRTYGVYLMNPDGSDQVNLTHHRANDLSAVWSPTGEQILFVSDRDGVRDLYLMDADGSNVRRVFKKEANRQDPSWSPDGKQITYTHMRWDVDRYPIYIATLGEQEEEALGVDGLFPYGLRMARKSLTHLVGLHLSTSRRETQATSTSKSSRSSNQSVLVSDRRQTRLFLE